MRKHSLLFVALIYINACHSNEMTFDDHVLVLKNQMKKYDNRSKQNEIKTNVLIDIFEKITKDVFSYDSNAISVTFRYIEPAKSAYLVKSNLDRYTKIDLVIETPKLPEESTVRGIVASGYKEKPVFIVFPDEITLTSNKTYKIEQAIQLVGKHGFHMTRNSERNEQYKLNKRKWFFSSENYNALVKFHKDYSPETLEEYLTRSIGWFQADNASQFSDGYGVITGDIKHAIVKMKSRFAREDVQVEKQKLELAQILETLNMEENK